ncbi:glycosyltransferase [Virgibacillus flavescens]|uniref:glycosyltransferase n=1 Tax=Virgibacillus flavescens TaxID=1611422 RepID=UPI003D33C002
MFLILMTAAVLIGLALISGFLMFWKNSLPFSNANKHENHPLISIIIPARNEENRIAPLLKSLVEQKDLSLEIIVVDDASTDRTIEIAKKIGARVLRNDTLEEGWTGKSAACWIGAKVAKGEWLLFLDADTRLHDPFSLKRLARAYRSGGSRGILSLQPYHTIKNPYENLSVIFNIIVIVGMNVFTIWERKLKGAGSFGPCILSNRQDYFASGGHASVRHAVMDDLALGEAFTDKGLPVHCVSGRGLINFQMYPEGFGQLVEGWTKNFGTASQSTHPIVVVMISFWISGGFLTVPFLFGAVWSQSIGWIIAAMIAYLAYMIQFFWLARRTGDFRYWTLVLYPLQFVFFTSIFLWSLYVTKVRHTVSWRGRKMKV